MTDPQYWADRRLAKGAGISSEHHSDKKKTTKYGQIEAAHHEIRFTDKMDGTTLLVKIFEDGRLALSMNGPFNITAEDLKLIYNLSMACTTETCYKVRER